MWLAGDAPAVSPFWQTWLPTFIVGILTAVCGVVGTIVVKHMNRRLDDATTDKTQSESRKVEAEAESTQVTTARGLVAEIRAMMVDQRQTYEGQLTMARESSTAQIEAVRLQHQSDMKSMKDRMSGIEAAFTRHREWDDQATAVLRQTQGDFPDPPPVHFD
jgi:hypothetical protein